MNKQKHLCVQQDFVPFVTAALLPLTLNYTKQGNGYRWPHSARRVILRCPRWIALISGTHIALGWLLTFKRLGPVWAHCSRQNALVTLSITAPAHHHATRVIPYCFLGLSARRTFSPQLSLVRIRHTFCIAYYEIWKTKNQSCEHYLIVDLSQVYSFYHFPLKMWKNNQNLVL